MGNVSALFFFNRLLFLGQMKPNLLSMFLGYPFQEIVVQRTEEVDKVSSKDVLYKMTGSVPPALLRSTHLIKKLTRIYCMTKRL